MQEEGLSLLAQSKRLEEYAERKDLNVIKRFEIIESSTRGERKQFMEMINFCKKQKETIAIVADTVDRVQRSFKESVLLDELMRKDKIELHFYREGMVLNSKSTSADIMRWDFSVMGAKAYVLQLSENVRRSVELKVKNGEITNSAPIGYENYVNEHGKNFVRVNKEYAVIIRKLFEMYSLGRICVRELAKYANMMGLRNKQSKPVSETTLYYMFDNPFYYGEMRTKRGLIRHIYPPIVSKELWDKCQEQRKIRGRLLPHYSEIPFLFRNLIMCGITQKKCLCELKQKCWNYVVCYTRKGGRMYIQEQVIIQKISSILNCIKLPNSVVSELHQELKQAKVAERRYCQEQIEKLKSEQNKLKEKLDHLFDLRLDGELDRATFDTKRNEIQLKIDRLKVKIKAHEKANNSFDDTILGLLDITTEVGQTFAKSDNLEIKRLLLKFVFENITLTEGEISYKLNFPFNEFTKTKILEKNTTELHEQKQSLVNQDLQANYNQQLQFGCGKSHEVEQSLKNKGVAKIFATPLQFGRGGRTRTDTTCGHKILSLARLPVPPHPHHLYCQMCL